VDFTKDELSGHLQRILALNGSDAGFFVLALHALIEAYVNSRSVHLATLPRFRDKMDELFYELNQYDGSAARVPELARRLSREHYITNQVRHQFMHLSREEALGGIHNFLAFAAVVGWEASELEQLSRSLDLWQEESTPAERLMELEALRQRYRTLEAGNAALQQEVRLFRDSRATLEHVTTEIRHRDQELQQLRQVLQERNATQDQLRRQLWLAEEARKELEAQAETLTQASTYQLYLERFTAYTRTRADYERSVMRLSPEQQIAAERVRDTGDYLIRGAAGTGKTLVLLHAMREALRRDGGHLGFDPPDTVVLLTYTSTLVRFDRYLTEILGARETPLEITTVDRFLQQRLRQINPRWDVDYHGPVLDGAVQEATGLSTEEVRYQIEDVIFGGPTDRERYLDPGAPGGLRREVREILWKESEKIRQECIASGRLTRNLSRLVILESLEHQELLLVDRMYVDEVQDLAPVELKLLRRLSRKGLVMAGDEAQAIYQIGMSFRQLGIGISGRTTVLRANYRNTAEIAAFAHRLRGAESEDDPLRAHRHGPPPEVWIEQDRRASVAALVRRTGFFIQNLQYAPENIGVLAPDSASVEEALRALQNSGFPTQDVRTRDFDFRDTPGVRVSTLHSAKGVEFSVVMLYVPHLPEELSRQFQNLLHVAATRGMDNLQIFITEEAQHTAFGAHILAASSASSASSAGSASSASSAGSAGSAGETSGLV